ncbi:MAG: hypothetical protein QM703_15955 [Gemmatales bacterium]
MLAFLASEMVDLGRWALIHRNDIAALAHGDWGAFANSLISNPQGAISRQGSCLLYQPEGSESQLLGFFEQTTSQLSDVQDGLSTVAVGQAAVTSSITTLQTISMVSLGLSAITPLILMAQNRAISNRMKALEKQMALLHFKWDAAEVARLETALELLNQARGLHEKNPTAATSRYEHALKSCLDSMKYSAKMLSNLASEKTLAKQQLRQVALHLMVAILGAASCQVGLGQDQLAFSQSQHEMALLKDSLGLYFVKSVDNNPGIYLLPGLAEHGITLDSLTALYQQAELAGIIKKSDRLSASSWFEDHREKLFSTIAPWFKKSYLEYRVQFCETSSFVEEFNRIKGLERMVGELSKQGKRSSAVLETLVREATRMHKDGKDTIFWELTNS